MKAALAVVFAVACGAAGCGLRPLTSAELYGAAGAGLAGGGGGSGGVAAGGGSRGGSAGGANGGSPGGTSGGSPGGASGFDGGSDSDRMPDASPADGSDGSDGWDGGCSQTCGADQFCDELTGRCSPRAGSGMLSGVVSDACSGAGLSALVGIAGQHTCSYAFKGSYFFTGLPLGMVKLAAVKDGYEPYGVTVEIVARGVVQDIHLERVGGCAAPAPADVACVCDTSSCTGS